MKLRRLLIILSVCVLCSCERSDAVNYQNADIIPSGEIQADIHSELVSFGENSEKNEIPDVVNYSNAEVSESAISYPSDEFVEDRDLISASVEEIEPYSQELPLKKDYINLVGEKVSVLDENYESWEYWDNFNGAEMFFSGKLDCAVLIDYNDVNHNINGDVRINSPDVNCFALMVNFYMLYDVPEYITTNDLAACTGLSIKSNFGVEGPEYDYLYAELEEENISLIIYSETEDFVYSGDGVLLCFRNN